MPEQWYSGKSEGLYYYYLPRDSSFCRVSPRYDLVADKIMDNMYGGGGPEPSFPWVSYKVGVGVVVADNGNGHPELPGRSQRIWSVGIVDDMCDKQNSVVSVKEVKPEEIQVRLYPNPARDILSIESPANVVLTLSICDVFGKVISTVSGVRTKATLNTSGLPSGIYFVKIASPDSSVVRKVLILH